MAELSRSIRIPESDILSHYPTAIGVIAEAKLPVVAAERKPKPAGAAVFLSAAAGVPQAASLGPKADFLKAISPNPEDPLLPPQRHAVYHGLRRALAVGFAIGESFVAPLGFLELGERARSGAISAPDKDKLTALVRAKAVVSLFAAATHLSRTVAERPSGEPRDVGEIPYANTSDALGFLPGAIAAAVAGVKDDQDFLTAVARACTDVMDRVENDAHRVMSGFLPEFVSATYVVEKDDFRLSGFARPAAAVVKSVDLPSVKPEEVIGNHIAKAQAERLARMIACYDFDRGRNPFVDVGGFSLAAIGDGNPGTGKTTLIRMVVTLLKGYADLFGYQMRYENFGADQISEFQGKSGERCRAFIDRIMDPKTLGLGSIDDVDMTAGRRDDDKASEGALGVTAVLMDAFGGAATVVRGNAAFIMASNYPEKVDDALRQRAGIRWLIDGPQTREDYIDILNLLLGKDNRIAKGDHEFYATQAIQKMKEKSYERHMLPQEDRLRAVWDTFEKKYGPPKTIVDLGTYMHMIKEAEPRFTGRAVKNITDAVKIRSMDVSLPDEWFEKPEAFARLSYERKVELLEALRRPFTVDVVLQEINRYADSEFRYGDKSDEADIARLMRERRLMTEANRRFANQEAQ